MSLRGSKVGVPGSSTPDHLSSAGRSLESSSHDNTIQEGHLKPASETVAQQKPRRKSWLKKWQEWTNPQAEFSDEYVKERTGMTKNELAEWLKDPENKKKAEKLWPSAAYWAAL